MSFLGGGCGMDANAVYRNFAAAVNRQRVFFG